MIVTRRMLVLKFNPNHDAKGRFAESGSGRRGGTAGAPTEDAFGNPLKRPSKGGLENFVKNWNKPPVTGTGKFHIENPAGPGFRFSSEQRQRHARIMFGG
jgi:hypothetical protein